MARPEIICSAFYEELIAEGRRIGDVCPACGTAVGWHSRERAGNEE